MPVQTDLVCLQCGTAASRSGAQICRRCGLRFGDAPPAFARLASCPVCYRTTDEDGRLPSLAQPARRADINAHIDEHDRYPVGDDAWLETLRDHDRIRLGRWSAPYDLVRRYLVTGAVDAGRNPQIFGDQAEWIAAREAVAQLMDRYHATDARRRVAG